MKKTFNIVFGDDKEIKSFLKREKIPDHVIIDEDKLLLDTLSTYIDIFFSEDDFSEESNIFILVNNWNIDNVIKYAYNLLGLSDKYDFEVKGIMMGSQKQINEKVGEEKLEELNNLFGGDPKNYKDLTSSILNNEDGIIGGTDFDVKIFQLSGIIENIAMFYSSGNEDSMKAISDSVPDNIRIRVENAIENLLDIYNSEIE